jgi:excisionase family DNA binding protein
MPSMGTAGTAPASNRRLRRHPELSVVEPAVVDRHGAAHRLGIGLTRLAELTATGELPSIKLGRSRLYRVVTLDTWAAAHESGLLDPDAG